ncbi:MAG TPA: hypothetical protein VMV91_08410 [Rhodocyclaceae bacterium]|nr:hypothetical protein [Rhodocyclaceae bacterium]
MPYTVIVSFARDREYEFRFPDSPALPTRDEAQRWLDQEWSDLDCAPINPLGKVLTLDKLLSIARYAGEKRFSDGGEWAQRYARAALAALGRNTVRVDIAEHVVG